MSTSSRKLEHLEITLYERVEGYTTTLLDDVTLVHQALPGFDFSEVDLSAKLFGKDVNAPIVISGMTGGSPELLNVNRKIAELAQKFRVAVGVGSQRAGIERPETRETFSIVRKVAKDVPVIGNIGAPQLAKGYGIREISEAVQMIEADAVAIHFNPAQELFQPEGEPHYSISILDKLADISDDLGVPVILKETGCGFSREFARLAKERGFRHFDVQGAGGTSWVAVEMFRGIRRNNWKASSARVFAGWGIPTAASIVEVRYEVPDGFVIGSGGIRNGLDAAKAIALGADAVGLALPVLKAVMEGRGEEFFTRLIFEMKSASFLAGARDVASLKRAPIVIRGELLNWLSQRGIDLSTYFNRKTAAHA